MLRHKRNGTFAPRLFRLSSLRLLCSVDLWCLDNSNGNSCQLFSLQRAGATERRFFLHVSPPPAFATRLKDRSVSTKETSMGHTYPIFLKGVSVALKTEASSVCLCLCPPYLSFLRNHFSAACLQQQLKFANSTHMHPMTPLPRLCISPLSLFVHGHKRTKRDKYMDGQQQCDAMQANGRKATCEVRLIIAACDTFHLFLSFGSCCCLFAIHNPCALPPFPPQPFAPSSFLLLVLSRVSLLCFFVLRRVAVHFFFHAPSCLSFFSHTLSF